MDANLYHYDAKQVLTSPDELVDRIGSGSFGIVRRVMHQKLGLAAVKIFRITGTRERQRHIMDDANKEAAMLVYINHENVVRCHGVVTWSNYFAIIMDYIPGGTLYSLLSNESIQLIPWKLRFRMLHEISKAIVYLHNSGKDQRMVHGDLKTKNLFVTEDLHVRVGDFGAATLATKTADRSTSTSNSGSLAHTILYAAPEFLRAIYMERRTAMDIYSFGMVMYEVVTRKLPFYHLGNQETQTVTSEIIRGGRPDMDIWNEIIQRLTLDSDENLNFVQATKQCMISCWHNDPDSRPPAERVEQHFAEVMRCTSTLAIFKEVCQVVNQRQGPHLPPQHIERIRIDRAITR